MKFLLAVLIVANVLAFAWIRQHEGAEAGNGEPEFVAIPAGVVPLQLLSEREGEPDVHLAATEPENGAAPSAKRHDSEAEPDPEAAAPVGVAADSEAEAEAQHEVDAPAEVAAERVVEVTAAAEAETAPQRALTETRLVNVTPPEPTKPVGFCQTIGPFASEEVLNEGVAWLKEHGRRAEVRSEKVKEQTGYWVYLPAMAPELARRATEDFEAKGVKDYYRSRRNEISLGIYSKEDVAERRRKQIVALGYEPVLAPRFRKREHYWVDLRETEPEVLTDAEWAEYLVNHPNITRQSTDCR